MTNPFKPAAGMTAPVLIGREDDLEEFEMVLQPTQHALTGTPATRMCTAHN